MKIIITGALGFISSALISKLNASGYSELILVDDFSESHMTKNLNNKKYLQQIERDVFIDWFEKNARDIDFIYHLGARTDTAEQSESLFEKLNVAYSKSIWNICTAHQIPLVYASSAATYGLGELGYNDDHKSSKNLQPLNPYGWSKQLFDLWVLKQDKTPPKWAGIKFFNVFGPNEYHKSRMASVVMHCFNQVNKTNGMKLFRSHKEEIENGHQSRDFIYIKDVVNVLHFLMTAPFSKSGIYNLGTGVARTFLDLVKATFKAMDVEEKISFIDTPIDIRDNYQYFTEANMTKLRTAGYSLPFTNLEDAVKDYVQSYLQSNKIL